MTQTRGSGVPFQASSRERRIRRLIADAGIHDAILYNEPVDVGAIARFLGAKAIESVELPVDGVLSPGDDGFTIFVNRMQSKQRQRFSCAHEVAHVLVHSALSPAFRKVPDSSHDDAERDCEAIAAVLLMPDKTFGRYANEGDVSIRSITKLAGRFVTSIQSTAIRYLDVIEKQCVLIISKLDKKDRSRLRVAWSRNNVSTDSGNRPYFVPKSSSLGLRTANLAYRTNILQADVEDIHLGNQSFTASTESKAFGRGANRYVMTLIFPESTN